MSDIFSNSGEYADDIVDNTLDQIGAQTDDQQKLQQSGVVTFNPSVFQVNLLAEATFLKSTFKQGVVGEKRHIVMGPYKFDQRYTGEPQMSFGQKNQTVQDPLSQGIAIGIPSNYVPFLVEPYIYSWSTANGEIDGFYLGLYAVTRPPSGVLTHTVSWIALGKGSRYTSQATEATWSDTYDYNEPDYLEDDATDYEAYYEDVEG